MARYGIKVFHLLLTGANKIPADEADKNKK